MAASTSISNVSSLSKANHRHARTAFIRVGKLIRHHAWIAAQLLPDRTLERARALAMHNPSAIEAGEDCIIQPLIEARQCCIHT